MIFKVVFVDNDKQRSDDAHHKYRMQIKTHSAILQPLVLQRQILGAIGLNVNDERENGSNKRSDDKEMAEVADEIVH